jgi:hypothetical protein
MHHYVISVLLTVAVIPYSKMFAWWRHVIRLLWMP